MLPVDIIATFNTLGDIKPNFIRLEDEEHRLHTYKISGIEFTKEDKRAGSTTIVFVCYIEAEGIQKQLKLSYSLNSHKWVLL